MTATTQPQTYAELDAWRKRVDPSYVSSFDMERQVKDAAENGTATVNVIRGWIGYPPIPDGDVTVKERAAALLNQ
jgi:hypothetical protein